MCVSVSVSVSVCACLCACVFVRVCDVKARGVCGKGGVVFECG